LRETTLKLVAATLLLIIVGPSCTRSGKRDLNESANIEAVAKCLNQYKTGVESGDLAGMAPCHVPPQDEWDRATSAQIHANQDYLDTLVAMNALAEDPAKIRAVREQMNPFAGVSHYEFSDIQVEGNHATAKVVMTVGGERRPSVQKLVNVNGKWFIHSGESDTLSEADAREFKETADVTTEYAKAARELTDRVKKHEIAGGDAQKEYLRLNLDLQDKIKKIRAKHPTLKQ